MEITDLQVGQMITARYWFKYEGYDDCAMVIGTVTRRHSENAEIRIINSSPPWFDGRKVWIDRKTEIISINQLNNKTV